MSSPAVVDKKDNEASRQWAQNLVNLFKSSYI